MGDAIKKFFKKKKVDAKFKLAGPGHKLSESSPSQPSGSKKKSSDVYVPPVRSGLTDESRQAASAALARLEGKKPQGQAFNTSLAAVRAQAKRELEAEKNQQPAVEKLREDNAYERNPAHLAVTGVFFRCPAIGPEVLPLDEWYTKFRVFLNEQSTSDPGLTAVLKLHSLNRNKEKVEQCVEIITKYFENILQQPSEEKYRRIRKTNKIYLEKVADMEGATEVLEGAGFVSEGDFFVFPESKTTDEGLQNLEMLLDALRCAEPIVPELDRNLQVLLLSQVRERQDLPREFFRITPEELKREQKARTDALEKASVLMTKAMREKEELRELRNYKFCLIRVRFPDGIVIQGTFTIYEPFTAVASFVSECLIKQDMAFHLVLPTGGKLETTEERTLLDLRLVPATLLIFVSNDSECREAPFLLPEVEVLVQSLEV